MSTSTSNSKVMERLIAALCFGFAFVVTASILVPGDSHATDSHSDHADHEDHADHGHMAKEEGSLTSLGSIQDDLYRIDIFAGDEGPLYTIIEHDTGHAAGTLLTEEQVHQYFPDLNLPAMGDSYSTGALMMADDAHH